MNRELIMALDDIAKEKGINKDDLFETIEAALKSAYKKNYGNDLNVDVEINKENGDIKVFSRYEVVEVVENFDIEVSIEEAKDVDNTYEIGDIFREEVTPSEFGRIAAQTAKQVVIQRIREEERNVIYGKYADRENEIITGIVQRISNNTVFIDLGKTEAMILESEQIPGEYYQQGQRIKSYIVDVSQTSKGPKILLSRTHPGLVRRLFELEVPEIFDGEVEIRGISREAGSRTKIAVFSTSGELDPIGACIGKGGRRVSNIVQELNGEKMDIIEWSEDPAVLISNSLSPSDVIKVVVDEDNHSAIVVVPDDQLSLAIGKNGQNARLAAKLTNWKIDIKSQTQYNEYLENLENIEEEIEIEIEEPISEEETLEIEVEEDHDTEEENDLDVLDEDVIAMDDSE